MLWVYQIKMFLNFFLDFVFFSSIYFIFASVNSKMQDYEANS